MHQGLKIIELVRVSTDDQAKKDRAGIDRQMEDNRRTIERHSLVPIRGPIVIQDVSGSNVNRCPEIQDVMIPMMRDHSIQGVVTSDMDRLIRPDNFDDYALLQRFKENGIVIFTADNVIDLNTRTGFLVGGMKATIAGDDLSNLKKKMLDGKEQRRLQGKNPNSHITLPRGVGYDREKDAFILTDEISQVQEMFRLYVVEGWTHRTLAKKFGMTPRGIALLLANPVYAGWRVWDKKRGAKYQRAGGRQADRKKVSRVPADIIVRRIFDVSPVPEAHFARTQSLLNRLRVDHVQRRQVYPNRFYYSGLLKCAIDGEPLYSRGGATRGKEDYHVCKRNSHHHDAPKGRNCAAPYSNRRALYHTLDSFTSEVLGDPRILGKLLKTWLGKQTGAKEVAARMDALNRETTALKAKRGRFLALYGDDRYTKGELDALVEPLTQQIASKAGEVARIQAEADFLGRMAGQDMVKRLVQVFHGFKYLTPEQKRRLLQKAGITFKVMGNEIHGMFFCAELVNPQPCGYTKLAIAGSDGVSEMEVNTSRGAIEVRMSPPYRREMPAVGRSAATHHA